MAGILQLVARLDSLTGLSEDVIENTCHVYFPVTDPTGGEITTCLDAFADFYTVDSGAGQTAALATYISNAVIRGGHLHQFLAYFTDDLTGETPFGSPVGSTGVDLGAQGNSTQLPEEVSVCLSYAASLVGVNVSEVNPTPPPATIRPQQRRRGRLYFGPLTQPSGTIQGTHYRPSVTLRTDLLAAFGKMVADVAGGTTGDVATWSKVGAEAHPVVSGYVDDAWDTQRRRGVAPTTRTTLVF